MKASRSGFTIIEVMVATALLSFTVLTFIYALNQGHMVAGMSSQRLQALNMARDIMEQVRSQEYLDISSIPKASLGGSFEYECVVSANGSFSGTKDIVVTVSWTDVAGNTLSSLDLNSSAARWLH